MVDISNDLKKSAHLLLHHKRIFIPTVLQVILPLALILSFLYLSGVLPLFLDIYRLQEEYDSMKSDYLLSAEHVKDEGYLQELFSYLGQDDSYNEGFTAYLDEKGITEDIMKEFITPRNILFFLSFILIWFLGSFFFSCMSYSIIALAIKDTPLTIPRVLKTTIWFFFHLISVRFLTWSLILIPILLGIFILILLFFIHPSVGVLGFVLFLIAVLVYIIWISLRLFFTIPAMYLEGSGPVKSITHSYRLTGGYLVQVLIFFAIVYGLSIILNSYLRGPLADSYIYSFLGSHMIYIAISAIFLVFLVILEAVIVSFEHVFQFYAYLDLKEVSSTPLDK